MPSGAFSVADSRGCAGWATLTDTAEVAAAGGVARNEADDGSAAVCSAVRGEAEGARAAAVGNSAVWTVCVAGSLALAGVAAVTGATSDVAGTVVVAEEPFCGLTRIPRCRPPARQNQLSAVRFKRYQSDS